MQYVSINEEHDHILLTCNDRALRLYNFDYKALSKALSKDEGSIGAQAKEKKRIIYFKNEIKDHINNMKW